MEHKDREADVPFTSHENVFNLSTCCSVHCMRAVDFAKKCEWPGNWSVHEIR